MLWTHRTIIVPTAAVEPARMACAALAGAGGDGMFTTPLSPTGTLPATHWISSGLIEEDFAFLLQHPEALAQVATAAGVDPAPLQALLSVSDISEETWEVASERLGLKMVEHGD